MPAQYASQTEAIAVLALKSVVARTIAANLCFNIIAMIFLGVIPKQLNTHIRLQDLPYLTVSILAAHLKAT